MTAKQILLSESLYCRRRAADCADPFLAEELRRLADGFERTAGMAEDEKTPSDNSSERISH
jgi:hypothetical protein